jgi:hypothetical protein
MPYSAMYKTIRQLFNIQIFYSNWLVLLFFILFFFSIIHSINIRNEFYQEGDSEITYFIMAEFPGSFYDYVAMAYKETFISNYQRYLRENIVSFLITREFPTIFINACALTFGSTYSFGSGLVYGTIFNFSKDFDSFKEMASLINILLFHGAVLLIFLSIRKIGLSTAASAFTSIWFLFSTSNFNYQFHFGSTIWNTFTACIFLYFTISNINENTSILRKKISLISALLIIFNYLILLYWLSIILFSVIKDLYINKLNLSTNRYTKIYSYMYQIMIVSLPFITVTIIIAIVFYQTGQGVRAYIYLDNNLFEGLFFTFFNIFTVTKSYGIGLFIEGVFVFIVLISSFFITIRNILVISNSSKIFNSNLLQFSLFILCFFVIFFIFLITLQLAIAPSRHILFISPLLYLMVSFFIDRVFIFKKASFILTLTSISFCYFSYSGILKYLDTFHNSISLIPKQNPVLLYKSPLYIKYKLKELDFLLIDDLVNNKCYYENIKEITYISIETPLSHELLAKLIEEYQSNSLITTIKIVENNTYYIAYNPNKYSHNRSNNLYIQSFTFKVSCE